MKNYLWKMIVLRQCALNNSYFKDKYVILIYNHKTHLANYYIKTNI